MSSPTQPRRSTTWARTAHVTAPSCCTTLPLPTCTTTSPRWWTPTRSYKVWEMAPDRAGVPRVGTSWVRTLVSERGVLRGLVVWIKRRLVAVAQSARGPGCDRELLLQPASHEAPAPRAR